MESTVSWAPVQSFKSLLFVSIAVAMVLERVWAEGEVGKLDDFIFMNIENFSAPRHDFLHQSAQEDKKLDY